MSRPAVVRPFVEPDPTCLRSRLLGKGSGREGTDRETTARTDSDTLRSGCVSAMGRRVSRNGTRICPAGAELRKPPAPPPPEPGCYPVRLPGTEAGNIRLRSGEGSPRTCASHPLSNRPAPSPVFAGGGEEAARAGLPKTPEGTDRETEAMTDSVMLRSGCVPSPCARMIRRSCPGTGIPRPSLAGPAIHAVDREQPQGLAHGAPRGCLAPGRHDGAPIPSEARRSRNAS